MTTLLKGVQRSLRKLNLVTIGIVAILLSLVSIVPSQAENDPATEIHQIEFRTDQSYPLAGFVEPVVTIKIGDSESEKKEKQEAAKTATRNREVIARSAEKRVDIPVNDVTSIARAKIINRWGEDQWNAFYQIVQRESGWRVGAKNARSGACGLGQALPCSKMGGAYGSAEGEIDWTIGYIAGRYKTPAAALAFHNSHGWY